MTIIKRPLDAHRLRSALPRGFGWIDHRFLRDGYLSGLTPPALGLYCLLVCASDSQGLSFYSDQRLRDLLAIDAPTLLEARGELIDSGLLAYQKPLCQLLALHDQNPPLPRPCLRAPRPSCTPPPLSALSHPPCTPPPPSPPEERPPAALPATALKLRAMVAASLRERRSV